MNGYYIGLMSGTSMDSIDAGIVSFERNKPILHANTEADIPKDIKIGLTELICAPNCDLRLLGEMDTRMGALFAEACLDLLQTARFSPKEIIAIGSHGQTIHHAPNHEHPFTLQIGDPNIIAARTKITTVADFRRKDMALGGQAAPLTPAFHAYLFGRKKENQWVLNIGGIANLTFLSFDKKQPVLGFDTGPGNTLLDQWYKKNRGDSYDLNGTWAESGKINQKLLAHLLDDPYFQKSIPKSTGREYFNLNWLRDKLHSFSQTVSPVDVQTTLTELTAKSISDAILKISNHKTLWVCGGGAFNCYLMKRLRANLPTFDVFSTEKVNINPKCIELTAFAWLAKQTLENKPGNLPSVTGAKRKAILGGIYYP